LKKGNIRKRKSVSVKISWTDECQAGFDYLKTALRTASTLKIPDFSKPFQSITEASDFALGGILLQEDHAIAYKSRILNSAGKNYPQRILPLFTVLIKHIQPMLNL
jgi:hypothetical protein